MDVLTRVAPHASMCTEKDVELFHQYLGRVPRGLIGVGARCVCGNPAVTITLPRLPKPASAESGKTNTIGEPFPTLFYLALPWVVKRVSQLEAGGLMNEFNERLHTDEQFACEYADSHSEYIRRRALLGHVSEIDGVSAGGMPSRVKCLHALAGYSMSCGKGANPVGDIVIEKIEWGKCFCEQPGNTFLAGNASFA